MKVLVSGSTGLIGNALIPFLATAGHSVTRLVRSGASRESAVKWDPILGTIDRDGLEGHDGVVHLAGQNIAAGRWTPRQKKTIRESRAQGTRLLCEALLKLHKPPQTVVSASAVGIYGDRGDEILDERSLPGKGFLADVCREWESATEPARQHGLRVVNLRFGIVLSANGGALAKMLTPFKFGLGGTIGTGRQYWSWIDLDDVISAILHALTCEQLTGPTNGVAPHPETNYDFTKILGRVLKRPTVVPLPAFAARLTLGQMADELLLASQRVMPRRLEETGFAFRYPELEPALRHSLGKSCAQ